MRLPMFYGSRILEINPITKEIVWQYTGIESGSLASWTFKAPLFQVPDVCQMETL